MRRRFKSSLPLMGIGNRSVTHALRNLNIPHYPSWGLETLRRHPEPPKRDDLITPHGDWKRTSGKGPKVATCTSLPLMGIGNPPAGSTPCAQRWLLITPHGDWKLDPHDSQPRPDRSSLPLMGIGNCASAASKSPASFSSLPLMGIGNYHRVRRIVLREEAHYPSWGLETNTTWQIRTPSVSFSLPLMGIGNPITGAVETHGLSDSLPLMGIGNPRSAITLLLSRLWISLPLMGIGNPPLSTES